MLEIVSSLVRELRLTVNIQINSIDNSAEYGSLSWKGLDFQKSIFRNRERFNDVT